MILKDKLKKYLERKFLYIEDQNEEIIYAHVWHDTIKGITWLKDLGGISPGRWAVGYNYLYVMTRILNEKCPKQVLEFGLGVSTTLINEYFKSHNGNPEYKHIVVEHDNEWSEFYAKRHPLSDCTTIENVDLIEEISEEKGAFYKYANLDGIVKQNKWQVISVDAPFRSDYNSRSDILDYIPDILSDDFVIVIDDMHRKGEKETMELIKKKLDNNNIRYDYAIYRGTTYCAVIASENNKFLCSL